VAVVPPEEHEGLIRVLTEAQRIGALGTQSIVDIIAHARSFADALPPTITSCVDLGSGAGVPGLVIAIARPSIHITLVDRRSKRTDTLQRAVRSLNLENQVSVVCADIERFAQQPETKHSFDAACARGFGPPEFTLKWSARLVKAGGVIVVSEPPLGSPDRWKDIDLHALGVSAPTRLGPVAMFHVEHL
jgi:16S rRNA (guanine527-N7)-methyltransferase